MDLETPLPLLIEASAQADSTKTFIDEIDGRRHSYGAFHDDLMRWAAGFAGVGVRKGDLVATMLPTSITAYHAWLGLSWIGSIEVPINPQFVGQTLAYPLNNSRASVLVIAEEFVERLGPIADDLPHLKTVVVVGENRGGGRSWQTMTQAEFLDAGISPTLVRPRYDDAHAVIYTSGTTGPSKGVLQPWVNLHGMAAGIFPGEEAGEHPDGATFSCWPTFHSSGKFGMCIGPQFGLRMVFRESFSVSSFWDDVRRYRITHAPLLVVSAMLISQPPADDDSDNPLLRVGMYPLIPEYREFERRFGVRVSAGYGTTEVGWAVTTADPANHRTNGVPSPGYQVRIADERGEPVPVGTTGEILVRHDRPWRLNKGYLGMPEATAEAWRDGWFHTGDAGKFDDEGNLYFVDRLKDSLRHRGHNISSFEVEAEVLAHPAVMECACVGVPSDLARDGESVKDDDVKVFVVLDESGSLDEEELWSYLRPRMPKFMLPRHIEFVPELPKTPTGKVMKVELRKRDLGSGTWTAPDPRRARAAVAEKQGG